MSEIPEYRLNISVQPITAQPRRLKQSYGAQAAEDLRRLYYRLVVGDYVLLKGRVVVMVDVGQATDGRLDDGEKLYRAEDLLTGAFGWYYDKDLGEPLNAMEVLAWAAGGRGNHGR
jgi:hypothetical protein